MIAGKGRITTTGRRIADRSLIMTSGRMIAVGNGRITVNLRTIADNDRITDIATTTAGSGMMTAEDNSGRTITPDRITTVDRTIIEIRGTTDGTVTTGIPAGMDTTATTMGMAAGMVMNRKDCLKYRPKKCRSLIFLNFR
jgi:hypothetical protein